MQSCAEIWLSEDFRSSMATEPLMHVPLFVMTTCQDCCFVFTSRGDRVQGAVALLVDSSRGCKAGAEVDPSNAHCHDRGAPFLRESIREINMGGLDKQFVALMLLMSAGYSQAAQLNTQADAPTATAMAICPAQDISFFIQRFSSDEAVQRSYTSIQSAAFPVMPLVQERKDNALVLQLEDVRPATARVDLSGPDTGDLVSYYFKMDDCWRLVRIENQSPSRS